MTVKELISELSAYPESMEVWLRRNREGYILKTPLQSNVISRCTLFGKECLVVNAAQESH